jgi:hypothetical protein
MFQMQLYRSDVCPEVGRLTFVVRCKLFLTVRYTKSRMTTANEIVHIVGLKKGDFGRNCSNHKTCGQHVEKDDVIVLKRCIIGKQLKLESCIAAVKLDSFSSLRLLILEPLH